MERSYQHYLVKIRSTGSGQGPMVDFCEHSDELSHSTHIRAENLLNMIILRIVHHLGVFKHDVSKIGCFHRQLEGKEVFLDLEIEICSFLEVKRSRNIPSLLLDDGNRSSLRNAVFEKPETMDNVQNNNHVYYNTPLSKTDREFLVQLNVNTSRKTLMHHTWWLSSPILTVNSDYFLKQRQPTDLCNGEVWCFLCGTD
jgi:hypothetical protein